MAFRLRSIAAAGAACLLAAQIAVPAAQAKRPVLAVAGTFAPASSLSVLAAELRADGYRVTTMALPNYGQGDIATSANSIARAVRRLRARTGAKEVDLIGHSQAGLENRYYLKFLDGTRSVRTYVSLGTPQYGFSTSTPSELGIRLCSLAPVACRQMRRGSPFLQRLNRGDDAPPGAVYYSIWTSDDELATPPETGKLRDGGRSLHVQHYCSGRDVGHLELILDRAVLGLVSSALRGGTIRTRC